MSYCIYLRKSRADIELEANGELETLTRHEKILLELAKKQKLTISAIYKEIVSGETIAARPAMQQLLDEVETGMWEGVLVMEIERLARGDTIDQGIVAKAFKVENTKIITPTKTYDPSNEFDEEYFEFGLFMSRREYKTINRRMQRGVLQSAKDGKYLGSDPPYGYDRIRISNDKGFTLMPNDESETVKLIFDLYLKGDGCSAIARQLDSMKIDPRRGGAWSRASIRDILKNPVYIGKIQWSKGNQNILADGLHPPIIEDKVFQNAQYTRQNNYHPPVKANADLKNPLSGLIFCKKCGKRMTRLGPHKKSDHEALICTNRYCNNVSAPIWLIEEKLIEELKAWLEEYKLKVENEESHDEDTHSEVRRNSLTKMRTELTKIEKQLEKTYDLLEQGIYTTEVFLSRSTSLSSKKEEVLKNITQIEEEISTAEATPDFDFEYASNIIEAYLDIELVQEKNHLLKSILDRVEYEKDAPNTKGKINNANFKLFIYPRVPTK